MIYNFKFSTDYWIKLINTPGPHSGFIHPLLNITDNNYKAIAAPIFDFLETFKHEYWHYDGCGFGYDRYFGWIFTAGPHDAPPWRTPGILGGAFLATKRRLEEIEYLGRGMVGWGGENIELSLKNWMCDGEIYYVPCSRWVDIKSHFS